MPKGTLSHTSEAERAELEAVLRSRVLQRSPGVLRIAEYISKKYLEGEAEEIKEYNIAVDGLGKPNDFDPRRDSIVRVEAHRLRKKIDEFYRTEGAAHKLRLVIDTGNYVPRFESVEAIADPEPVTIPAIVAEPIPAEPKPARSRRFLWALAAIMVPALALAVWSRMPSKAPAAPEPIHILMGMPIRVTAGADSGLVWHGDRWFHGGSLVYTDPPYPATPDVSHAGRRTGDFTYDIPLADGPWELRLYFGSGAHGFDVSANGVRLLNAQDPQLAAASPERPIVRVFRDIRPAADGMLHLFFRSGKQPAYVNAISLTPGEPGRSLPIRLTSRATPWIDREGNAWGADGEFVTGGKLKVRTKLDAGAFDRNLLMGERYGAFTYSIPVAKGTYTLKLYLVESWFGPGMHGGGGIGNRRFDVYADRQPLLQDFDLFREFGNKPIAKEFPGLKPNADGYINLSFVPRSNYAEVNALELTEETARK
jgi:hypothetical protein